MKISTIATTGLALGIAGCSGAAGMPFGADGRATGSSQTTGEEITGQLSEPIYQGTVGGGGGVVGLIFHSQPCAPGSCPNTTCTGAIVAHNMVVTAAHCVTQAGWQQLSPMVFEGTAAVTYLNPRTRTFQCLTRTSGDIGGACQDPASGPWPDFVSVNGLVEPNFTGSLPSDARHDLALVYVSTNWPAGIDRTDAARIVYGSTRNGVNGPALQVGDQLWAFGNGQTGYGVGEGTLRFAPNQARVDALKSGRIANKAGSVRVCYGDSGGPLWLSLPNLPFVFGVLSSMDTPDFNDFCAARGTYQYWAGTDAEIGFISSTMQLLSVPCSTVGYIFSSTIGFSVLECW